MTDAQLLAQIQAETATIAPPAVLGPARKPPVATGPTQTATGKPFRPGPLAVCSLQLDTVQRMARLSYESMITLGYDVYVYSYESASDIQALPVPAQHLDARHILPESAVFMDADGAWDGFTNLFQFQSLWKHGGLWIDNDYVLLRSLPTSRLLGIGTDQEFFPYLLRLPPRSELAARGLELAEKYKHRSDPREKTCRVLRSSWLELRPTLLDPGQYLPLPATATAQLLISSDYVTTTEQGPCSLRERILSEETVGGVHLWQPEWTRREFPVGSGTSDSCLYQLLWRLFF